MGWLYEVWGKSEGFGWEQWDGPCEKREAVRLLKEYRLATHGMTQFRLKRFSAKKYED